jgi:hypothetical protein
MVQLFDNRKQKMRDLSQFEMRAAQFEALESGEEVVEREIRKGSAAPALKSIPPEFLRRDDTFLRLENA